MPEYIELSAAVCIADYAADEHPYEKDPATPETFSEYNQGWNDACDYIRNRLESKPAADVEPVIRCKDCKKSGLTEFGRYCSAPMGTFFGCIPVEDDSFCSGGVRKNETV
nr:MAG TPA: baseplate protein [Caudoviricetes sp.]